MNILNKFDSETVLKIYMEFVKNDVMELDRIMNNAIMNNMVVNNMEIDNHIIIVGNVFEKISFYTFETMIRSFLKYIECSNSVYYFMMQCLFELKNQGMQFSIKDIHTISIFLHMFGMKYIEDLSCGASEYAKLIKDCDLSIVGEEYEMYEFLTKRINFYQIMVNRKIDNRLYHIIGEIKNTNPSNIRLMEKQIESKREFYTFN